MTEIQGDQEPISFRDQHLLRQEFKTGAELFQKALHEHAKSTNPFQQQEFREVMDKALDVIRRSAAELHNKTLIDESEKITEDYSDFQGSPTSQAAIKQLDHELDRAKNLF
jgi:hypothetical protein